MPKSVPGRGPRTLRGTSHHRGHKGSRVWESKNALDSDDGGTAFLLLLYLLCVLCALRVEIFVVLRCSNAIWSAKSIDDARIKLRGHGHQDDQRNDLHQEVHTQTKRTSAANDH